MPIKYLDQILNEGISNKMFRLNSTRHKIWFDETAWPVLAVQAYQNFTCTTTIKDSHFKPITRQFGQRNVGEVLLRKNVNPGRSYKVPSRVQKSKSCIYNDHQLEHLSCWWLVLALICEAICVLLSLDQNISSTESCTHSRWTAELPQLVLLLHSSPQVI